MRVTISNGGDEAGKGAFALLESTAEVGGGELPTGPGGLEVRSSDCFIRAAKDVPSRIRDTRASIRCLLTVSGDSSNSRASSAPLDLPSLGEELPSVSTIGLDGSAVVAVGLDESASRIRFGLDESKAVAAELEDCALLSKSELENSCIEAVGGLDRMPLLRMFGVDLVGSIAVKDSCDCICRTVAATSSKDGKDPSSSE